MFKHIAIALGLVMTISAVAVQPAAAQKRGHDRDGGWEDLGCVETGRRTDRDIIKVGRREGRFSAIKLSVSGNDVEIEDLKVVYGNGKPDDIRVRSRIREGQDTRPLDLAGGDRFIDRIEIVSKREGNRGERRDRDSRERRRGPAKICVSGLDISKGRGRGPGRPDRAGDWQPLGCQKVGFFVDRDAIVVGQREGRFRAIRLDVSGNDVYIMDLKVIYANGAPDDIRVRSEIRQGGQTRPLDLQGRNRAISRVELTYRAKPNFRGTARVCVSGR